MGSILKWPPTVTAVESWQAGCRCHPIWASVRVARKFRGKRHPSWLTQAGRGHSHSFIVWKTCWWFHVGTPNVIVEIQKWMNTGILKITNRGWVRGSIGIPVLKHTHVIWSWVWATLFFVVYTNFGGTVLPKWSGLWSRVQWSTLTGPQWEAGSISTPRTDVGPQKLHGNSWWLKSWSLVKSLRKRPSLHIWWWQRHCRTNFWDSWFLHFGLYHAYSFMKVSEQHNIMLYYVYLFMICLSLQGGPKFQIAFGRKTCQEDSEGSGHLAMLPSLESMNLPAFWKDSDLQLLEGSEVHTHAVRLQEELLEDFEELQKRLRWPAALKDFTWAHTSLIFFGYLLVLNHPILGAMTLTQFQVQRKSWLRDISMGMEHLFLQSDVVNEARRNQHLRNCSRIRYVQPFTTRLYRFVPTWRGRGMC